jgi:hypothetical protein
MAKKRPTAKKKGRLPPPTCKAILLCQMAIFEQGTGNPSLVNIFDRIVLDSLPGRVSQCVFLQLVNGIGAYDIVVEVHDLGEDKILGRATVASIEFPDRTIRANVVISMPGFPITHTGIYEFVVLANDQEIDRQQFIASLRGGQSP